MESENLRIDKATTHPLIPLEIDGALLYISQHCGDLVYLEAFRVGLCKTYSFLEKKSSPTNGPPNTWEPRSKKPPTHHRRPQPPLAPQLRGENLNILDVHPRQPPNHSTPAGVFGRWPFLRKISPRFKGFFMGFGGSAHGMYFSLVPSKYIIIAQTSKIWHRKSSATHWC